MLPLAAASAAAPRTVLIPGAVPLSSRSSSRLVCDAGSTPTCSALSR